MKLDNLAEKPLFIQFAESIEDNILKGIFKEETQIPSINEAAIVLKINPATANKGVNLLVDEGIIYKKRGVGMFVSKNAQKTIKLKRKKEFYNDYVKAMLEEAQKLEIDKSEIIEMINKD